MTVVSEPLTSLRTLVSRKSTPTPAGCLRIQRTKAPNISINGAMTAKAIGVTVVFCFREAVSAGSHPGEGETILGCCHGNHKP